MEDQQSAATETRRVEYDEEQPYADEAPPKRDPVDARPLEALFGLAKTVEDVREAAKRVKALPALTKEQLAHLRKVRAAAEARIGAAGKEPAKEAPADGAAPPAVEGELIEPGSAKA
jgi:hypothetical protein